MTGRTVHRFVLDCAASMICGAAASAVVAVVVRGLLGAPMWLSTLCSLVAVCVTCWRVTTWNNRQDELEKHRAEVDS